MTDLIDEVKESFSKYRDQTNLPSDTPVGLVAEEELDDVLGFFAMRDHYLDRYLAVTRRGYYQFAGCTPPTQAEEWLGRTTVTMMPMVTTLVMESFCDGVLIGHQDDYLVRMKVHFKDADSLFTNEKFRDTSRTMAAGFAEDKEVKTFFAEFLLLGLRHMAQATGFLDGELEPDKVWDLWMLVGNAVNCTSYLAGFKLGTAWQERDVLDGIVIASEDRDGPQ